MDPYATLGKEEFLGGPGDGYFTGVGEEKLSDSNLDAMEERKFIEEPVVDTITVGSYLAQRLVDARATTFFTVPGDFILSLLDSLLANKGLRMVGCCNELNAGYAADGFCRATGELGILVVTYMVGGLSALNAVAGAYSEDLPLLVISGGPNTNDGHDRRLVHHTIGEIELYQSSKCFEPVVAKTFVIRHIKDAARMIDEAILTSLSERKPVYLELPVNLNSKKLADPSTLCFTPSRKISDPTSLYSATGDILRRLEDSAKPVVVAGSKIKAANAIEELRHFNAALGSGFTTLPDAKGLLNESDQQYMGSYWAGLSHPYGVQQVVENSDLILLVGAVINDYVTVGWTALVQTRCTIEMFPSYVIVCGKHYSNVQLADLLGALALKAPCRPATMTAFERHASTKSSNCTSAVPFVGTTPLILREFQTQLQHMVRPNTSLILECGDSWFIGQQLLLTEGANCHYQLQYGSCGWALGALLGVAVAVGHYRRVVGVMGDGSFQMTAQELGTLIRQRVTATIFVLNNKGYATDVEIHDGPYNDIKNWDYAGLMSVMNAGTGDGLGFKVTTAGELQSAISRSMSHRGVTLIEIEIQRDDCTAALLEFGSKVEAANGRP